MANKLDEFMAEIKAFDYKWFDEIGGNEALAEIGRLREQASGTTTLAGGRLKLVRVYEESEVEEVSVGEYRLKNRRR